MRQLKKLTIIVLPLTIILFIVIYSYQKSIYDNLYRNKKNLTETWNNFGSTLKSRDNLLDGLISTNADSLKYWLQKSILERNKKENTLDLVSYEYKINKIVMDSFPNQKQIAALSIKLNSDISTYDSLTREYNKYISIFPNFIIARNHNYQKEKYFTIKYGEVNEDPIKKAKEIPEWAKGVDTN